MATAKNREGCTYRHKISDAVVLCVKTRFMSQGTARHTLLVLDAVRSRHKDGAQTEVDETPARRWEADWEET
jgi:hypothetical protein